MLQFLYPLYFCIFLLYLCAIAILNFTSFIDQGAFYGLNPFPAKSYKGVKYKAGEYESLVITLGEGKGDNWWCVLFPPLCMLEAEDQTQKSNLEYKSYIKEIIDKYL